MSNIAEGHKLKQLNSQKTKLLLDVEESKKIVQEVSRIHTALKKKLSSVEKKISNFKKRDLVISEHAILRYIERVKKIDINSLRDEILTKKEKEGIIKMGDGKFPTVSGCKVVVAGGVVVSIL